MNLRTKLLRGGDDTTVLLVYPSTVEEYRQSLAALGGGASVGRGRWRLPRARAQDGARVLPGHHGSAAPALEASGLGGDGRGGRR